MDEYDDGADVCMCGEYMQGTKTPLLEGVMNKTAKMRHCWYCGEEMGIIESRYYDQTDTCGKLECDRAARHAAEQERDEAHEKLDRDMGW